ncbi:BamA/TamA family outer membrane protein [Chitinophaga horti]|uniref:BamA/TamA family outer membrane protein n=1 Tax=Chitinophaga horti TaxID=2920382 RepID=A0ABY6IZC6_9BACT|nr:BamA/TamA family outer membrane protein [Chitinophaga horti]UYQ92763.1 BamA/TamA family outer membrane protein [Chitinophaga horti]
MRRKFLWSAALLFAGLTGKAQQADTLVPARKNSFFPLPAIGYAPEKGFEIGVAGLYSFYIDNKNPSPATRNSSIILIASVTTEKQWKLDLRTDFWTRDNAWHLKGNVRYHDFPFYFYGTGDSTHYDDRSLVGNRRLKGLFEAEKRFGRHFFVGPSLLFQHDRFDAREDKGIYPGMTLVDKDGGHVTYIGVTGVFDNRDNQNYTRQGSMVRVNGSYAPEFLSSYPIWKLELKANHFFTFLKNNTVGLNAYASSIQGGTLPFYQLQELGNDFIMRGYYAGRYRDQNYLAGQAEYRYFIDPKLKIRLWKFEMKPTFALVAFAGTGSVFANRDFDIDRFKPNFGGGIRYFYDKSSRLTIRLDYGIGEQRPGEKRQTGFYLSLGEAF